MKKEISALFAFLILVSGQVSAQDAPAMRKPGPGPERARLAFLVGSFATETHIMPEGGSGKGTSVMTWGLDSMFLKIDEHSANKMFGIYEGHGMLGFERRTGKYFLSMFNNFGDAPQYRGGFEGDTLVLATRVEFPGGSFDQKLVWFKENNTVRLKIYNDMGKGAQLTIDQIYTPASQTGK